MDKGITGLDRAQLSRLVELVVGGEDVAPVSIILTALTAVRVTLMYLRTNASQEAIAEIMWISQPTISRTIAVITRIITRVLGPLLATAEKVPAPGWMYIIDGREPSAAGGAGRTSRHCSRTSTSIQA